MNAWVTIVGGSLADTGADPSPTGMRLFAVDSQHQIHLTPVEMRQWRDALDTALAGTPRSWRVVRDDVFVGGVFDRETAERLARSLGPVVAEYADPSGLSLDIDFGDGDAPDVRRVQVRAVA